MGMFDRENCFSWKQSIVSAVGTVRSEKSIDLGVPGTIYLPPLLGSNPSAEIDIGKGEPVECLITVNETVTSGGAATVQAILSMGTGVDGNGDINAGEVTLFDSGAIAVATLVAGYQFKFRSFFPGTKLRYLQLRYVIAAFATTAGKITAGIVDQRQTNMVGL
jgi:hypothetical protein